MKSVKYIGLDVHQATIVVAVLDGSGKLVMESVVETRAATILEFISGLPRRATHNLRGRNLGRLAVQRIKTACQQGRCLRSAKKRAPECG